VRIIFISILMHTCVQIEKTYTVLQELVTMKSGNHDYSHN